MSRTLTDTKPARNMSIELMRCSMMFGIVLLHIIVQDGWFEQGGPFSRRFINLLSPCVEGFVFISGYYGIRFSTGKMFKLLALFVFYRMLFVAPSFNWNYVIRHQLTHNWFLYSYFVLMVFAPLFNAALEGKGKKQVLALALPTLVVVYGWSYLCVIPGLKDFVPVVTGFAPLSFFTMFGIYIAARVFRLLELERLLNRKIIIISGGGAILLVMAGFHHHNSPASLVWTACMFTIFSRLRLPPILSRIVAWVAPTTFGIFLIHSTLTGNWLRKGLIDFSAAHCGVYVGYLITTVVMFAICCFVDKLRMGVTRRLRGVWGNES